MDRNRPRRAGFTLVELLVAILIIAALLALLLPALQAAFRRGKEAQVSAELNNIATALAAFNQQYGFYPPSRVLLCEAGFTPALLSSTTQVAYGPSGYTDVTEGQLAQRTLLYLKKMFPRCTYAPTAGTQPGTFFDFNGNGNNDHQNGGYYILSGAECLAFFLGGLPGYHPATQPYAGTGVVGFGRLPTNPFIDSFTQPNNRTTPFYEFNVGRLVDLDGDQVPTYVDVYSNSTLGIPYAYFSSYGTNAYDPNDVNDNGSGLFEMSDDLVPVAISRGFNVAFPPNQVISSAPNPYTSNEPVKSPSVTYLNANTFQLFSAGADQQWGIGGLYLPNAGAGGRLPLNDIVNTNLNAATDAGIRSRESDNLTNFSGGRLD
jgi:general secretion pathway protein G